MDDLLLRILELIKLVSLCGYVKFIQKIMMDRNWIIALILDYAGILFQAGGKPFFRKLGCYWRSTCNFLAKFIQVSGVWPARNGEQSEKKLN